MSAESKPSADDSDSLSMLEVLEEQSRMQEDASAVLGDSDEQNCTYPKGYVQRQALYACATCVSSAPAGVCLACSYQCHDGHELYELYTKRHFRCDCGNSKFSDNKCKLVTSKDELNTENQYNQNFRGKYCMCSRPYPDPDDEVEDEMIQCVVCEDWYHGRHLKAAVPPCENYSEMVCTDCMKKLSFLWAYQVTSPVEAVKAESGAEGEVEVGDGETGGAAVKTDSDQQPSEDGPENAATTTPPEEPPCKKMKSESSSDEAASTKPEEACFLRDLQKRVVVSKDCAAFWPEGWREKLCKCSGCQAVYREKGVGFLQQPGDTVHAYEERGRRQEQPGVSDSQLEHSALSSMNHWQKVEMLQGFNEMKTELKDFLKSFADNGKVVAPEDIKAFFARMDVKRKERAANMQFHCK